ncbi:SoxW family protein [Helicobacter cetorum]|uniref:Thiol:disulfide interchange protein DsbC n=1 Tax=Helicobacter cetorum (strain ATCC BAA-429 / MIT 00-7128) TaxID=182217 RepID=I0EMS1_HELC0|nr:thioredoxin fold domain-containing protein [Helicobacter cetorum]AFI04240.1 thiol:disulfide interchange protein DsbC [Helicobacter cetorum MIT 00-7128]
MHKFSFPIKNSFSAILLVLFILMGCKSDSADNLNDTLLSSGSQSSKELENERENIDKKSYAGLEDIFLDTKMITPNNKLMLLIFGRNGCSYCEHLKEDIKNVKELHDYIQTHFNAYYINISYSKLHNFKVGTKNDMKEIKMPTEQLAQIYGVQSTPTIIFSDESGKTIYELPGYMPSTQFLAVLEFIGNGEYKKTKNDKEFTQHLKSYIKYKTDLKREQDKQNSTSKGS